MDCVVLCGRLLELLLFIFEISKHVKRTKRRRFGVREIYQTRDLHGFSVQTFRIIKERDPEHFKKATRMSPAQFDLLFSLIKHKMIKKSHRKPIDAETRLAVTLLYLSHGAALQVMAWCFKIGVSTARKIIYETCAIIWDLLSESYVSPPNESDWQTYERSFWERWDFPNCVGAIDGKHINIQCPPKAGSLYFNYKGHHSIVLLAACDHNYLFTAVDIGTLGSRSDGGVFANSVFGKKILNSELPGLPDKVLPGTNILFPHFFVADSAFPLRRNIMRPFPNRGLSNSEEYFNKRLSRARRTIENAFGILAARWRVLTTTINAHPKNVTEIVKATVVLHNFCKTTEPNTYVPPSFIDAEISGALQPGGWRNETNGLTSVRNLSGHNSQHSNFELRDVLKNFIVNEMHITE